MPDGSFRIVGTPTTATAPPMPTGTVAANRPATAPTTAPAERPGGGGEPTQPATQGGHR
jgi:hypothetical protein